MSIHISVPGSLKRQFSCCSFDEIRTNQSLESSLAIQHTVTQKRRHHTPVCIFIILTDFKNCFTLCEICNKAIATIVKDPVTPQACRTLHYLVKIRPNVRKKILCTERWEVSC